MPSTKISTSIKRPDVELKIMRGLSLAMLGIAFTGFGASIGIGWLAIVYVNNPLTQQSSSTVLPLPETQGQEPLEQLTLSYWSEASMIHAEVSAGLAASDLKSGDAGPWSVFSSKLRSAINELLTLKVPSEDRSSHLELVVFYEQLSEQIKASGNIDSVSKAESLQTDLTAKVIDFEQTHSKLRAP